MYLILLFILVPLSLLFFLKSNSERKGLKFTLSILTAILLAFSMEAIAHVLLENKTLEGIPLIIVSTISPILFFGVFQLLIHDVKVK